MKQRAPDRRNGGSVRIIGGKWRGRKLNVGDRAGLRPTADRNRETLFNWLQTATPGARVLDLFAGSGALGFEALSRGASHATLLELHKSTAENLKQQTRTLEASDCSVVTGDAIAWLETRRTQDESAFDLAFLDPPFESGLLQQAAQGLEVGDWLNENALIYAEFSARSEPTDWPENWVEIRRGGSREAGCVLFSRQAHEPGAGS